MILSIVAAGAGGALAREAIFGYYKRKAARSEIRMVRDRRGRFVDAAKLFERKMFYGWLLIIVGLGIIANLILLT